MALAVAAPVGSAWGAAHETSKPARTKAKAKPKTAPAASVKTYAGPSVDMHWGPVQVSIVVQGKKILDIKATAPMERERSAFINQQALPMLRSEVLHAQGINNVYAISGATMTSEAYGQSLLAALNQAHISG